MRLPGKKRWSLLLGLAVLCAGLALAPAGVDAKPPRWLLPPYHFYTLTYEATTTFDGTAVESYPNPIEIGLEEMTGLCDWPETSTRLDGRIHARIRVGFVFGRYRYHGRTLVTSTHRMLDHSVRGAAEYAGTPALPAGCPSDSRAYVRPPWICHYPYREDEGPRLELHASHQLRSWRAEIAPVLDEFQDPRDCQGELERTAGTYGGPEVVMPGAGQIRYTIGGILAGRTFHGQVATDPAGVQSGGGTIPQAEEGIVTMPQSIWRSQVEVHASLTMAPARGHKQ